MPRKSSIEGGGSAHTAEVVNLENVEALAPWRVLKTMAPMQAEHEIKNIEGFDDMEVVEQIESLKTLLATLADNNDNRFVAEIIAHRIYFLEDMEGSERHLEELGVAA